MNKHKKLGVPRDRTKLYALKLRKAELRIEQLEEALMESHVFISDIYENLEIHVLNNEDDWSRNPQAEVKNFIESLTPKE